MITSDINFSSTFQLATTYTIGSHILPGYHVEQLSKHLNTNIKVSVESCMEIINGIKDKRYDMGLIENPIFDNQLNYHKWIENELVICSNVELPLEVNSEFITQCTLICREESSETRKFINSLLSQIEIKQSMFKSLKEINNVTAAIQSVKWSKPNKQHPIISIISKFAIEEEVKQKRLFISRFQNFPMRHNYYIVYPKKSKDINIINNLTKSFIN